VLSGIPPSAGEVIKMGLKCRRWALQDEWQGKDILRKLGLDVSVGNTKEISNKVGEASGHSWAEIR